jgi:hypothetical protein
LLLLRRQKHLPLLQLLLLLLLLLTARDALALCRRLTSTAAHVVCGSALLLVWVSMDSNDPAGPGFNGFK